MFCPECGTKNDDDARFCENCGTKLQEQEITQGKEQGQNQAQTQVQAQPKPANVVPRQPMSSKTKMILVLAALVVVAIIVFSVVGNKLTDPERIALNYFKDVASADWEKVYNYYDLSESEFVNKSMYKKAVEKNEKIDYTNYAIKNDNDLSNLLESNDTDNSKNQGISRKIKIEYALKNSNDTNLTYTVKLVKAKKKKLLFFDNWKVVPEDMLAKDYSIRTLKNVTVKLDGIELSDKYLKEKSSNSESESSSNYESKLNTYEIPSLFKGNHKIEFTGKFIEKYKDNIKVSATSDYCYSYTNPEIKESIVEELEDKSEDVVKKLYEAAIDNKEFDSLELPYKFYKDNKDDIEDRYDDLVDNMDKTSYSSEIAVKSIDLKEFEITDDNSYIDEGTISATIAYKSEYEAEFAKKVEDKEEKKKDEGNVSGTISYKYDDGEWKISRIYLSRIYYYWY